MTNVNEVQLNGLQIEILRQMIGFSFSSVRRNTYRAYRNGYCANDIIPELEVLSTINICHRCESGEYIYYYLTQKGSELLSLVLGVKIILEE